jgi:hypothetical protein
LSRASERRLECSEAFDVAEAFKRGALRVASVEPLQKAFEIARADYRPPEPIEYVRDEGHTPYDLIGTTDAEITLVSEKFRDVLHEEGFTGWTTFPVLIRLPDESDLQGYEGLAVTGRCGPIDDRLSEEVIQPRPVPGGRPGPALRGLCFEPDSWDGSDIFSPEGYAGSFVVERVKRALERAAVKNVVFERLSEIERIWRADMSVMTSE